MSVRSVLPFLLALLLGAGAAGLVACGDDSSAGLLPASDAEGILRELDAARDALAAGECTRAAQAVDRARQAVESLPRSVDDRLVRRIDQGIAELDRQIVPDCEAQTQEETVPTTTTVVPETTTTTETQTTETQTTEPAPTETDVPEETQPGEPTPGDIEPPADTGPAVPPDGGQDGTGGITPEEATP